MIYTSFHNDVFLLRPKTVHAVQVITGFDPKYNSEEPLFFERLYQPFLRGQNK